MSTEGYGVFDDPYTYAGSTVLKNRLNLRDQAVLDAFEVEITILRTEEALPTGDFDVAHYCAIHRHLFQDVYNWAGQFRTVRVSKGSNAFCYPEYIPARMDELFRKICNGDVFANLRKNEFANRVAEFLGELNAIHPFREGNGRSQLVFAGSIGATFGHAFHFERLARERFLAGTIDSYSGRLTSLVEELDRLPTD